MKFLIFCTILSSIHWTLGYTIPADFDYPECASNSALCEYWLVVQEKLTMIYDGVLVYSHNGTLIKYDEYPGNYSTNVSPSVHCG